MGLKIEIRDMGAIQMRDEDVKRDFANHVQDGLSARPRWLSSKYIYDAEGSKLFEQIMALPEYYLTRAEYSILEQRSADIAKRLPDWADFDVIEFGAGDGTKTRLLLAELLKQRRFRYLPVDISEQALKDIQLNFSNWLPELDLVPQQAEYFAALDSLKSNGRPKLVLFLGSNIGNFSTEQTLDFLRQLYALLSPGDCLLTGFDLKKEPQRILAAYHDSKGVTQEFNRNLLHRINRELGGDFNPEHFEFFPSYHPETGEMRAYLVSTCSQDVYIETLGEVFHFEAWDAIHTEISRKYTLPRIEELAAKSGFELAEHFLDSQGDFVDSLWQVKSA